MMENKISHDEKLLLLSITSATVIFFSWMWLGWQKNEVEKLRSRTEVLEKKLQEEIDKTYLLPERVNLLSDFLEHESRIKCGQKNQKNGLK
jgi:hypothetical protein